MRFTLIVLLSTQISFRSVSTSIMTYLHDRQQNNEAIWIAKGDTKKIWSTQSASNGIVLESSQSDKQLFHVKNVNLNANTAMFNLVGTTKYFCKNSDVSTTYSSSTSTLECVWTMYGEQARVGFQAENGKMCTSINFGGSGGTNYIRCPFTDDSWWNINSTTNNPTSDPTATPSVDPSSIPTTSPSFDPSSIPTDAPTKDPSNDPTDDPTNNPTLIPTVSPTNNPTNNPTKYPSKLPSKYPTNNPISEGESVVDNDISSTNTNMNDSLEISGSKKDVDMLLIMIISGAVFICVCAVVVFIIWRMKNKNNELKSVETYVQTQPTIGSVSSITTPVVRNMDGKTEMMSVVTCTADYGQKDTEGIDTLNTIYSAAYGEGNDVDNIANMNNTNDDDAMVNVLNNQHETKRGIITHKNVNVDDIVDDINNEYQTKAMYMNDNANDIVTEVNKTKDIQDNEYEYYYEDEQEKLEQINATRGGDHYVLNENEFEVIDDNTAGYHN